jgi:uncharacterized protein (DUF4415 family)
MARKSSVSSQPVRLKRVRSEDIVNRQWSDKERLAVRRIAESQAAGEEQSFATADIPALSAEQLAAMVRLRDARKPKVAVSVRLDARVLEWLKSKGSGHLTRVNDILANVMEAELRSESRHC